MEVASDGCIVLLSVLNYCRLLLRCKVGALLSPMSRTGPLGLGLALPQRSCTLLAGPRMQRLVAASKRSPLARTPSLFVAAAGKGFGKAAQQQKKKQGDEVGVSQRKHSVFLRLPAATPPLPLLLRSSLQSLLMMPAPSHAPTLRMGPRCRGSARTASRRSSSRASAACAAGRSRRRRSSMRAARPRLRSPASTCWAARPTTPRGRTWWRPSSLSSG